MYKKGSNLCKRAIKNETLLGVDGLRHKCKRLSAYLGLPDVRYTQVSKGDIKKAILDHSKATTREEVEASRKVGDRATEDPQHKTYLSYMTLPNSRIWMRVRARSIKGVKVNNKRSFNNLSCRFADDDTEETQEHLEGCRGCDFKRRNLTMRNWK